MREATRDCPGEKRGCGKAGEGFGVSTCGGQVGGEGGLPRYGPRGRNRLQVLSHSTRTAPCPWPKLQARPSLAHAAKGRPLGHPGALATAPRRGFAR